jgi:hypothetical protein
MIKDIPGFEGYQICSDTGLVFSKKTNKWLKMRPNLSGYGRTEVRLDGKRKHIFNHIKVVDTHGDIYGTTLPPHCTTLREFKLSIDHLDENKMNPSKTNLELVLHSENVRRSYERRGNDTDIPDLI